MSPAPSALAPSFAEEALGVLRELTGRRDAAFREGQDAAVAALVERSQRALVVQRTGWGKSAVYFVSTALLRRRGAGPTLLVSPLLALMRDQVAAAARAGIRASRFALGLLAGAVGYAVTIYFLRAPSFAQSFDNWMVGLILWMSP